MTYRALADALGTTVPAEFVAALLAVMPDAAGGPSPGQVVYFPCDDPKALDAHNRLFNSAPGSRPDLAYELEVTIPEGTPRAEGVWHGAHLPGVTSGPEHRVWVVDPRRLGRARVVRAPIRGGGAPR